MRTGPLAIAAGVAILLSGSVAARVAQESSPRVAGTRNAIVGRVVDNAGRPVSGVFVTLLQDGVHWNGVPRVGIVRAGLGVRTDASGAYRLESLPLGSYYVVGLPENPPLGSDGRLNRAGHGITYYPAASTRADARQVMVTVREPAVADITMLPATLASISGTVIGQDGKPVSGGTLRLAHGDGMFGVHGRAARIRSDGVFVLAALPPGTYLLLFSESTERPARGSVSQVSGATVVLDGRDVSGIHVAPIHTVRATGRIVIDPQARKLLAPATIHVSAFPVIDGMPGSDGASTMNDDLSFAFNAWPKPNFVRVMFDEPGWVVKGIRYKGTDLMKTPIDFKEGQPVDGIEIEVARAGRLLPDRQQKHARR
jgi:hypothetical protein